MTQKEIEAGNKLIAEFMGGKFYEDTPTILETHIVSPAGNAIKCIDKLRYHFSFDWLMPVVEKTDEYGVWTIRPGYVSFKSYNGELREGRMFHFNTSQMNWETTDGEPVAFIFLLYSIVVKYLTWRNRQSLSTDQSTLSTPQQ
jgi:hypothetical protein